MLELLCVAERARVVPSRRRVARLGNLERSECVDRHEGREVHAVARATEHVLMEEEVGTEEDEHRLQVDNWGVLRAGLDPRLCRFHYFTKSIIKHFLFNIRL